MATPQNLRATGDRIEQLLEELRVAADPRVFARTEELLRLVTDLYGGGLMRMVELVASIDPAAVRRMVDDELVASLLIVHGLHPDDLAARLDRALTSVRPLFAKKGGDVELVDVDAAAGAVLLRVVGSCDSCSAATLRSAVEQAISEAAPEIVRIDIEEPEPAAPAVVETPVQFVVKPRADRARSAEAVA